MKRLCLAVTCAVMLSMSGCMEYSERTHSPIVYETTTVPDASQSVSTQEVQNYIMQISSTTSELSYAEEGKTDKHLACVLRVKDDSATTLLVNLYDELGRITGTTKGDVTVDYEYDKESRVTKESKYYKGLYQGCCVHEYFSSFHSKTSYAADGKILYDGETYDEYFNTKGQLAGKTIYVDEKTKYSSITMSYDRTNGWITNEYLANRNEVVKEARHSYKVNERGNLVETVTDGISGKVKSETTYIGNDRSEDKILRYEEYDPNGDTVRGYENRYIESNGRYILEEKNSMDINSITGKITADMYFYSASSTSKYNIEDDIYEKLGLEPNDFSRLTIHTISSGYFDFAVTYDGSGAKIKTVTSKRDDSGRVVEVRETGKYGTVTLIRSFEYDEAGNCTKMTIKEGNETTEYIFGYISVPDVYIEPFSFADAEEYIVE